MVRKYVRKSLGPLDCWKAMPDKMRECVEKVKKKEMSKRKAAECLGISVSVFRRNMRNENSEQPRLGRGTVFTDEEEQMFVKNSQILFRHGLPFTYFNLRIMVSIILSRGNRIVPEFKNNVPGPEWAHNFVNRHKELSELFKQEKRRSPKNMEFLITFIKKNLPGNIHLYFIIIYKS